MLLVIQIEKEIDTMNSITMSFDDSVDINVVYKQLKKQYPKSKIMKNDNPAIRAMEELQKAMEGKADELGLHCEENAVKWTYEARDEIRRERRSENIV